VGNPLLNARALSDKLEESISNKNLCLYFQEFQLFIGAKLLDDCLKTMKTGDRHASPDTLNKIEEFIEKTSKKYIELGGEKKTLEILLTTFLEKNHNELCDEISNSLDRNIERLDLVYDALKKRYIHSLQSKQTGNESQKISWPPSLPKNT
jgi:hypothetical protein